MCPPSATATAVLPTPVGPAITTTGSLGCSVILSSLSVRFPGVPRTSDDTVTMTGWLRGSAGAGGRAHPSGGGGDPPPPPPAPGPPPAPNAPPPPPPPD